MPQQQHLPYYFLAISMFWIFWLHFYLGSEKAQLGNLESSGSVGLENIGLSAPPSKSQPESKAYVCSDISSYISLKMLYLLKLKQ